MTLFQNNCANYPILSLFPSLFSPYSIFCCIMIRHCLEKTGKGDDEYYNKSCHRRRLNRADGLSHGNEPLILKIHKERFSAHKECWKWDETRLWGILRTDAFISDVPWIIFPQDDHDDLVAINIFQTAYLTCSYHFPLYFPARQHRIMRKIRLIASAEGGNVNQESERNESDK